MFSNIHDFGTGSVSVLSTEPTAARMSRGRSLHFLANVDPIDVARALRGLSPETTLVVVVSKTFTTAETMLNARTVRSWLTSALGAPLSLSLSLSLSHTPLSLRSARLNV